MPMRPTIALPLLLAATPAAAAEPGEAGQWVIPAEEQPAVFEAAGFRPEADGWHGCDDPGTASYTSGWVDFVTDINGDGRPDAVVTEASGYCYGAAGRGFYVVSKGAEGGWSLVAQGQGFPLFRETRSEDGWLDMEVGGPGFCFPVLRWDGTQYVQHRFEYEGKPCVP